MRTFALHLMTAILSLPLIPGQGGVTTPILSRKLHRRRESVDLGTVDLLTLGPCFPPSLIMCWALEDQLFTRFFSAVTVGIGG